MCLRKLNSDNFASYSSIRVALGLEFCDFFSLLLAASEQKDKWEQAVFFNSWGIY